MARPRRDAGKDKRPIWVLPADNCPVLLSACPRDLVLQARYFCREGDDRWRPIGELDVTGEEG